MLYFGVLTVSVMSAKCFFLFMLTCTSSNKKPLFVLHSLTLHFAQWRDIWRCLLINGCSDSVIRCSGVLQHKDMQNKIAVIKCLPLPAVAVTELLFLTFFFPIFEAGKTPDVKVCSQAVKVIP